MTRRSFFFVTFTLCNILARGQGPASPPLNTSATATLTAFFSVTITFSEQAKQLPVKCLHEAPFLVGETIWWVGGIIVDSNAPPCTPPPTTGTPPAPVGTPPAPVGTPPAPVGTPPTPVGTPPTPVGTPPTPVGTPPTPVGTPPTPVGTPPTPVGTPPTPVGTPPTPVGTPPTPVGTPPTPVGTPPTPVGTPPTPVGTPPPTTCTPPPPAPPVNIDNKCSLLTYTEECKGIRLLISKNEDGSICLKQATFNEKLGTVALLKTTWIADKERAMYQSLFGFYGTIDKEGKMSIVETTPDDFKQTQKAEFVVVGVGKSKEWTVITSSNKSVCFVIYDQKIVPDGKAAEAFKAEIEGIITQIGFKVDQLKPVPHEISSDLEKFIPLVGAVGESGPPPPPPSGPPPPP